MTKHGIDPQLDWKGTVKLADGKEVEVATAWNLYQVHLKDYDLDTVSEITSAPKELMEKLAQDIATIKPTAIHQGEGIAHWFHATEANRAAYLPMMLTGNIGKHGTGVHGWAGNYKAALFQGSKATGPGFKGWVAEDPFELNLDPAAHGKEVHAHAYTKDEEPAYWDHGDEALIVETSRVDPRRTVTHPYFGSLTLEKLLRFGAIHVRHHAGFLPAERTSVTPQEVIDASDSAVGYGDGMRRGAVRLGTAGSDRHTRSA